MRRISMPMVGTAVLFAALCWWWTSQAGAYERRFIWTEKEKKQIEKLEKTIDKAGKNADGFYVYETPHWNLNIEISPRFAAEAAVYMELYYDVLSPILDLKEDTPGMKPTLTVFDSEVKYQKAMSIPGSRGVFSYGFRGEEFSKLDLLTYMDPSEGRAKMLFEYAYHPVIQHEGTHCLLQRRVGAINMPDWLNEGFAEYFENWDLRAKTTLAGKTKADADARRERMVRSYGDKVLREYVQKNQDYPRLSYLISLETSDKWDPDNMGEITGQHYKMAESFVDALLSTPKGREQAKVMVGRMMKKEPPVTEDEIPELELMWYEYLDEVWSVAMSPKTKDYVKDLKKQVKDAKKDAQKQTKKDGTKTEDEPASAATAK